MSFGSNLRNLRIAAGLTQEQLAKKINLSKANVSKYEAGTVEPNLETLVLICKLFDVSADYMLNLDTDTKPTAKEPEKTTSKAVPQVAKDMVAINSYFDQLSNNGKEMTIEYVKLLRKYEAKEKKQND